MDYSFFDALIDGVFVVGSDRGVIYCNESAAKLCDSSVRRLAKGRPLYESIEFSNTDLFVMPDGHLGESQPAPYTELSFKLKSGKEGKVQIAIQPFNDSGGEKRWVVMLRDVTLEEVLHAKYHGQLEEKEVYIKKLEDAQSQLEAYSKNLEQMVEERTQEVKQANAMLSAIMNSLGQGFLVFNQKGECSRFYTRACEDILEGAPADKNIWDVLRVPEPELATFKMWLEAIYADKLPFDSLKSLGPSHYPHTQGKHIILDYFPIRTEEEVINNIVVVATDSTSEYLANQALEKEKKYARMVIKLVTSRRSFESFLDSVPKSLNQLHAHIQMAQDQIDYDWVFRVLHTMEGEAGTYSIADIWLSSRGAQEVLEPLRKGKAQFDSEYKAHLVTALDEVKNSYTHFMSSNAELFAVIGLGRARVYEVAPEEIEDIIGFLSKKGQHEAAEYISDKILREPIGAALRHFDDIAQSVAVRTGKAVKPIEFIGADTRLYLDHYQDLFASLIHAIRNAVDHGSEPPEEREMIGKLPQALIQIKAELFDRSAERWLRLVIKDDGRGIDPLRIKEKLSSKVSEAEISKMSEQEILQHVFDPGLSTKEEVGEFSGRGVGLNAVLEEAQRLGGTSYVESELGKSSTLVVEVPDLSRVVALRVSA